MSPLLRKNDIIRLYPKKLNYLFLAVFAFSEAFCYAKTAFSYSPDILSPCTPDVTMVKNVVKSMSKEMICGHHFEVKNISQNRFADREELHRMQRRNTQPITCGLPTESNKNYVVRHKANYMVKLCGRGRESHSISSSAGVVF